MMARYEQLKNALKPPTEEEKEAAEKAAQAELEFKVTYDFVMNPVDDLEYSCEILTDDERKQCVSGLMVYGPTEAKLKHHIERLVYEKWRPYEYFIIPCAKMVNHWSKFKGQPLQDMKANILKQEKAFVLLERFDEIARDDASPDARDLLGYL